MFEANHEANISLDEDVISTDDLPLEDELRTCYRVLIFGDERLMIHEICIVVHKSTIAEHRSKRRRGR